MRRPHPWVILVGLLGLVLGCGALGYGETAELDVTEADRIEVRRGERAWLRSGRPEVWDDADLVAEVTDPEVVGALVEELEGARFIDLGGVAYDLAPPDYQVGFLLGDELLERLGYYERLSRWGEYEVEGRWITNEWDLLAVTVELPVNLD